MDDLPRELAPIPDRAWELIEEEARRTLKTCLAARKLVDFRGPLGWQHSAENLGRVARLEQGPAGDVEARLRQVQPLVELRRPFELTREVLDDIGRGAADPDLEPVVRAARQLAYAEDYLVFYGFPAAGVKGICTGSVHEAIGTSEDYEAYPRVIAQAVEVLREAAVAGPYAIALSPKSYTGLATTVVGGYPVIRHVEQLIDGPIIWAPALTGALVMSLRGGDFELVVGRDISLGYLDHDLGAVRLYLEESLTFRLLTPEAAIAVQVNR